MAEAESTSAAVAHVCQGPWPSRLADLWACDCSCGWSSPLVLSYAIAVETFHEHRDAALAETPASRSSEA
jgi:hypothetical protein